ncbi:DUF294 nucleotidyltransferase-like domain-containing protein [Aquibacillus sediminis]|uniref:DUF294 nucleotidyltransferase-like domain-containing protein n=1 Tax=Aquibacillus sediminis TaxID=2574734 RepID=UPI001FE422D0|nr:DUF294 nucleotidyltransferase-like domain-containing protein [Aquibacillus sediminis]
MLKLDRRKSRRDKGSDQVMESYTEIKKWRWIQMSKVASDHEQLNKLHDHIIRETVHVAMKKVCAEWGSPPAPFAFFLMGSGGRFEQSIWSDQDHGIIYDGNDDECQSYFLELGKEITHGLAVVDYELCDGYVMASYPLWCQSISSWQQQIKQWLQEARWESLRHFSTFFDSRVVIGREAYLKTLKETAFSLLKSQPHLYIRLVENVAFIQKGIGVFGQLLPETRGEQAGTIKLKQTTFFPYVNALRLLALKNDVFLPSTLSRFKLLENNYPTIGRYRPYFQELLDFRLRFCKHARSYKQVHVVHKHALSKEGRQQLKVLMKNGYSLFSETKSIVEKECSLW